MGLSSLPAADDGEWGCLSGGMEVLGWGGGEWECLSGVVEMIGKYHLVLEGNSTFFF